MTSSNTLDDIFGSSPPPPSAPPPKQTPEHEPSDLPSLRRQHVTTGYRDGVSESKTSHVQPGFDVGYPIGAQLGLRAGTVLGILEGVVRGFESSSGTGTGVVKKPGLQRRQQREKGPEDAGGNGEEERREKRERILRVYRDVVKELDVGRVFSGLEGSDQGEGKEKEDVGNQLRGMGDRVISNWETRVAVAGWEENMEALEMREHQTGAEHETEGGRGETS